MRLTHEQLKVWLRTRHLVDDLNFSDIDFVNLCQRRVVQLFGLKQILQALIEHLSKPQHIGKMTKLHEGLKDAQFEHETQRKSACASDHNASSSTSSFSSSSSPSSSWCSTPSKCVMPSTSNAFDMLSDDVLSYICGYLDRAHIINLKLCCSRMAMVCLEEMQKLNVGVFNANELLDCDWNEQQSLSFANNAFIQHNHLLKYSRYQSLCNVQPLLAERYNISPCHQLLCATHAITKFPSNFVDNIYDIKPRKIEAIVEDRLELHNQIEHRVLVKWHGDEQLVWESRESLSNLRVWKEYQLRKFRERAHEQHEEENEEAGVENQEEFVYTMEEEQDEDSWSRVVNHYHGCIEFVLFDKRRIVVLAPHREPCLLCDLDEDSCCDLTAGQNRLLFLKYKDVSNCQVEFVQFLVVHPLIRKHEIAVYIKEKFLCTSSKCNKYMEQIRDKLKHTNIVSDACIDQQQPSILIKGDISTFGSILTFQVNSSRFCIKKSLPVSESM